MPERRDVFISYSRANTDFARDLYAKLQTLGFTLWRDRSDMEGGDDWWRQIQEAIEHVDTMLLILSPAALASKVVAQEWHYARQKGTRVIPVLAQSVDWESVPRWMKRVDWLDLRPEAQELDLTWNRLIEQLRTPYEPRRVPFPEAEKLPADFVPRPGVFDPLLKALVDETHGAVAISAALRGAGGYGKTTLAKALIHDVRVRGAFDDGILWITLGERPENLLGKLQDLYVKLTDKPCPYQTLEGARDALAELLKDRYILIVIDDVWIEDHVKPFLVGGKHCAHLITTRYAESLPEEVTFRVPVDAMQPEEAVQLLASGFSEAAQRRYAQAFAALAERLFYWALLLKLANGVLRDYTENALETALRDLNELLDQAGISGLDDSQRVAKMLEATFGRLKPEEVERFRDLRVFPEDVRVPVAAIQRLWRATGGLAPIFCKRLLDRFERLSLLLEYDHATEMVRLHDAIRTAALAYRPADLPSLHQKFLRAYEVERWADLPQDEPYLWDHLAYHLLQAGKRDELRQTLLDYPYLRAKLNARDVNALIADLARLFDDPTIRLVWQATSLSMDALVDQKQLLSQHLTGRLVHLKDDAEVACFLSDVEHHCPRPELLPLSPSYPHIAGGYLLRTLRGHKAFVEGAHELHDGRLLSWASDPDKALRLWAADGREIAVLRNHEAEVLGALELSDQRLLSWSADMTLRLWSADGAEFVVLRGHKNAVLGALKLRDGRLLSWSDDKTLRLWAANGAPIAVLCGHERRVSGAIELHDGRLLSWSDDKTLRLWTSNGTQITVLRGHLTKVRGAIELLSKRLLSWGEENDLYLWTMNGTEVAVLSGHEARVRGALELQNGQLLSWAWENTLCLWAESGRQVAVLRGHQHVISGALQMRNQQLLSWSWDATLRLWSLNGSEIAVLRGHERAVRGAVELSSGQLLSWADDNTLRLWSADGTLLDVLHGHTAEVVGALELRDGRLLSWAWDRTLRLWAANRTKGNMLSKHQAEVNGVLELRNGRLLSWADDNTLRLWEANKAKATVLHGHESWVRHALELRSGRLLSWAGHELRLWTASGTEMAAMRDHEGSVSFALELQNGHLLSWAWDKTLRLWSADGHAIAVMRGHENPIRGALELQDGRLLSWSADAVLRLWSANGIALTVLHGHEAEVHGALELRDRRLLSWSKDKTLRLWRSDGVAFAVLYGHESSVKGALELHDGRLLSWSDDMALRLWMADGTAIDTLRQNTSPQELHMWLERHDAPRDTFVRLMRAWYSNEFSPERGLIVQRKGNVLELYRAETGERLAAFYAESAITAATFLQNGEVIALGCANGQVIFLRVLL